MNTILVTLLSVLCYLADGEGALIVKIDSPQCTLNSYTLKCDFGFTADDVVFDSQTQEMIQKKVEVVDILNVIKLLIPRPICMESHFRDIRNIEFQNDEACQSKEVSLHFHDSYSNLVPRKVKKLDVLDSEIQTINCDMGLQRLLISKSKVSELNSPWPVAGNQHMQIHNSHIKKLKALNLQGGLLLHVTNTTIDLIEKEAVILGKNVVAIFTESNIKSGEKGIIVRSGGRVLLHNTIGKVSIMAPESEGDYDYEKNAPGVPSKVVIPSDESDDDAEEPESDTKCTPQPYWVWVIPTVVASLEAIVLIKMCGDRIPHKKKLKLELDPEETSINNKQDFSPNSTFGYYNESLNFNPNLSRRK